MSDEMRNELWGIYKHLYKGLYTPLYTPSTTNSLYLLIFAILYNEAFDFPILMTLTLPTPTAHNTTHTYALTHMTLPPITYIPPPTNHIHPNPHHHHDLFYLLLGIVTMLIVTLRNIDIMNPHLLLTLAVMVTFIFVYVYAIVNVFYILYADDLSDIQIEVDTKLNYTYNHSYIISNALRNAALQNM